MVKHGVLICILVVLIVLLTPSEAFAAITGSSPNYTVSSDEYIAERDAGAAGSVQLKTASGATKFVIPSNIVGTFRMITIRTGRVLSADNYLTVTLGDGYTMVINNEEYASQGYVTIQESILAAHPGRGVTVKYNFDGEKDVKVYLAAFTTMGTQTGPTPTPAATAKPTTSPVVTPKPTVKPPATVAPTAGATSSPTSPPDPGDQGGDGGDGGTEEPCPEGCQALKDQLECPEWDEYMTAWSDMIKGTYPPPPDWYNVADIMRNSIVPAMGQELVNRSPEIAKIIADEFQSREKAVDPPPSIPDFKPPVPRFTDTPKVTGNLTDNVPNFQPDYSEDKGFVIPDPAAIQFNDNSDKGYDYQPISTATPTFSAPIEPSATDKGYKNPEPVQINPPGYVGGNYTPDETAPPYQGDDGPDDTMPGYEGNENTGDYRNYKKTVEEFKEYGGM